jgi:hypothetical protein
MLEVFDDTETKMRVPRSLFITRVAGIYHPLASTLSQSLSMASIISRADSRSSHPESSFRVAPDSPFRVAPDSPLGVAVSNAETN